MHPLIRLFTVILSIALFLSACNLPAPTEEPQGPGTVLTAAAQTVEANLTQLASQSSPTASILLTNTPSVATATQAVASPIVASPTGAQATLAPGCDDADFVADVTIPDGTEMEPGEEFVKTWRLLNAGTCAWTTSYSVVFSDGESMGGPASQAFSTAVNPGATVDLSINMVAPTEPGNYVGNWQLANAAGVEFATFYVEITVEEAGSSE